MNKDTVEVIINEGGLTCTTVNPLGKRPALIRGSFVRLANETLEEAKTNHAKWQQAESERKTYEIANQIMFPEESIEDVGLCLYQPGTIHQARIENGKAIIL